ncbi:MAG: integrase core domain-containing protein [Methylocella sp.]
MCATPPQGRRKRLSNICLSPSIIPLASLVQCLALLSRSRGEGLSRHDRQWRQLRRQLPLAPLRQGVANAKKSSPSAPHPPRQEPKNPRPKNPRTNGKAERFVQTSLPKWASAKPSNHSSERAAALLPFLHNYHHRRPRFGITGKSPISRISVNNLASHDS